MDKQKQIDELQTHIINYEQSVAFLQRNSQMLQKQCEAYENATFWKVTKPLRIMADAVKAIVRKTSCQKNIALVRSNKIAPAEPTQEEGHTGIKGTHCPQL